MGLKGKPCFKILNQCHGLLHRLPEDRDYDKDEGTEKNSRFTWTAILLLGKFYEFNTYEVKIKNTDPPTLPWSKLFYAHQLCISLKAHTYHSKKSKEKDFKV